MVTLAHVFLAYCSPIIKSQRKARASGNNFIATAPLSAYFLPCQGFKPRNFLGCYKTTQVSALRKQKDKSSNRLG